ncbi:proline-rich family protein [Artemisia annua]|uniref:Proline-rich family protein n=1 Tax=Artemisia annua TaxID=35608 RepID=A0A2U1LZ08_ARTAN|nr:proline-rich family protein [Artemisia annua]
MPGYTLDAPPNLRTSLNDRPISNMRGRPGAPSSRSSSIEPVPNGRVRRQSCSPSRGRLPTGVTRKSGTSVPIPALNRAYAKANDNVNPGSYGTKMVERVINMRKLMPPKQDDKHSPQSNLSGKSSSPDSGFGRSISKKSLDMAMRHMDIRRTIPGNLRPLMSKIPASSMYSVRTGPTRNRMNNVSDSLATSSNASSEMSVNNTTHQIDDNVDNESNSEKGVHSPASIRGRQNALRLEEKEKMEKQLLKQIIDEANEYKINFLNKRKIMCDKNMATNRAKEKVYVAAQEKFHAEAKQNYWKAIPDLIPKETPVIATRGTKKDQDKKPSIVVIQGPKPGKPTDLSRMRQLYLKLQKDTPDHLKHSQSPPPPAAKEVESDAATAPPAKAVA